MNINDTSRYITLDWDNCTIKEAEARAKALWDNHPNIERLRLHQSASGNGCHLRIKFRYPVRIASARLALGDDCRRLCHDLLNRPDHIHDILWSAKIIKGTKFATKELLDYAR